MGLYYGCDSGVNSLPAGAQFYVGRLGLGTDANRDYFSGVAAAAVGSSSTYAYWGLQGPGKAPDSDGTTATAAAWGIAQANACNAAWHANVEVQTRTLFADVEASMGGWLTSADSNYVALNYAVYKAFVSQLQTLGYPVGVYSSPYEWEGIMGSPTATAAPATVGWIASWLTDADAPLPEIPTSFSPPRPGSFGGLTPTIWQYYGGNTVDLNVASELPG